MADSRLIMPESNDENSLDQLNFDEGITFAGQIILPSLDCGKYGKLFITITHYDNIDEVYVGRINLERSIPSEEMIDIVNNLNQAVLEANAAPHEVYITIAKDYTIEMRIGKVRSGDEA